METCKEPGSWEGCCCCNCANQIAIMCHPWNEGETKGSIRNQARNSEGDPIFACLALNGDTHPSAMAMTRKHGMCEMHEPKTNV